MSVDLSKMSVAEMDDWIGAASTPDLETIRLSTCYNELARRLAERDERIAGLEANPILAERRRQVEAKGWTPEHGDQYDAGEMVRAAICYALHAIDAHHGRVCPTGYPPIGWPWEPKWWKRASRRRQLVKAGVLILAEIERLDRAEAAQRGEEVGDE